MKVYVLQFGDGSGIIGVYATKEAAEAELLSFTDKDCDYCPLIDEHEVEE
jgi:hypothetical protein